MLGDLLTGSVQELPMLCAALPTVLHRKWYLKPFSSKGLHVSQLVEKDDYGEKRNMSLLLAHHPPQPVGDTGVAGWQTDLSTHVSLWGILAFCQFFLVHRVLGEIWGFVGETPASFH